MKQVYLLVLVLQGIKGRSVCEAAEFSDDFGLTRTRPLFFHKENGDAGVALALTNERKSLESLEAITAKSFTEPIYFFAEIPNKNSYNSQDTDSQLYYTYPSKKLFEALNVLPNFGSFHYDPFYSNVEPMHQTLEEETKTEYDIPLQKGFSSESSNEQLNLPLNPPQSPDENAISYIQWPQSGKKGEQNRNAFRTLFGKPLHPRVLIKRNAMMIKKAIFPYYHRPKLRYPYYDDEGNGELMYGYGDDRLYHYEVFNPLQGYFR